MTPAQRPVDYDNGIYHYNLIQMWNYFRGHLKAFWRGFVGSGIFWGGLLFTRPPWFDNIFVAYVLKVIGAGILAFVSGLCTVLAQYYFEYHLKHKLFKNARRTKDNDKSEAA